MSLRRGDLVKEIKNEKSKIFWREEGRDRRQSRKNSVEIVSRQGYCRDRGKWDENNMSPKQDTYL